MKVRGLSPKLPLTLDSSDGYALNKTHKDMIKQNLKMLLLTSPGERIMEPAFGAGLRSFLFEQGGTTTHDAIEENINEQLNLYMPYVEIVELTFNDEDTNSEIDANYLHIKMEYYIKPLEDLDVIDLDFDFSKQLFI